MSFKHKVLSVPNAIRSCDRRKIARAQSKDAKNNSHLYHLTDMSNITASYSVPFESNILIKK